MKILKNKPLIQKLALALALVTLLNFCTAPVSQANALETMGGKLLGPIKKFATFLGDTFVTWLQYGLTGELIYAVDEEGMAQFEGEGSSTDFWGGYFWRFWKKDSNAIRYPIIQISPELIFGNKIEFLSIDFIGESSDDQYILGARYKDARAQLRKVVATWYVTLRTIAVVGLLSVLIYVGIRIIISSTSQDKAKYKQRLVDWVVAFCILFFMHYIMAATVTVVNKVDDLLTPIAGLGEGIELDSTRGNIVYRPKENKVSEQRIDKISKFLEETFLETPKVTSVVTYAANGTMEHTFEIDGKKLSILYTPDVGFNINESSELWKELEKKGKSSELSTMIAEFTTSGPSTEDVPGEPGLVKVKNAKDQDVIVSKKSIEDGSKILYYINYARLYVNANETEENLMVGVGFLMVYLVLVVFTGMFTFRYIKRVIYVAFLTLMAPMVAMTYPLDKLKDRKSPSLQYVVPRIRLERPNTTIPPTCLHSPSR